MMGVMKTQDPAPMSRVGFEPGVISIWNRLCLYTCKPDYTRFEILQRYRLYLL